MNEPTRIPRRSRWLAGLALAGAFVAGGLALPSLTAAAQGPAMHGMHGMAMAHVDHMLDAVGASADQKARITAILRAGFQPMADLHAGMRDSHAALQRLLVAPTIDRGALEQLRAGEIARIDQASKTTAGAIADAAEVLRPEQRAKLAGLMDEHQTHH